MVQESLTNVGKHAAATQVEVQVRRKARGDAARHRQRSRGFQTQAPRNAGSLGLAGLREGPAAQRPGPRGQRARPRYGDRGAHPGAGAGGGCMTRIVIADDHAIVREGPAHRGEAGDLEVVDEARVTAPRCSVVREREFDVLVLDLSMPGRSGMELIKLVKAEKAEVAYPGAQYAPGAAVRGACHQGWCQRLPDQESAPAQLVHAIRKIARGAFISAEVAEQLALGAMPRRAGRAARVAVGPRVRGVPPAGSRRVGHRHRSPAEPVGRPSAPTRPNLMAKMGLANQSDLIPAHCATA